MARIERSDGWPASGTVDTLQVALNAFFKKHKMHVIGKQVGETHVRQGFPRLARWLHGHFMPQRWLPKRAMVRLLNRLKLPHHLFVGGKGKTLTCQRKIKKDRRKSLQGL